MISFVGFDIFTQIYSPLKGERIAQHYIKGIIQTLAMWDTNTPRHPIGPSSDTI